MLKKTLKKLIATALTVATVATTMVAPVSAATLTPKKSHSKAEITEYVDYFNEITDKYTFRPDGYVPVGMRGTHDSQAYDSWQMTILLQNTPGITSEQKADMKKAASKWKKSYMSERMIYIYQVKWSKVYFYESDVLDGRVDKSTIGRYKAKVKKEYNEIITYITKYSKLNPKLAGELKKFSKQRFNIWNKALDNWCYKMTYKQRLKYGSNVIGGGANAKPEPIFSFYSQHMCTKAKLAADPYNTTPFGSSCTKHIAVDDYNDIHLYRTETLHLHSYDLSPNAPNRIWNEHLNWQKW